MARDFTAARARAAVEEAGLGLADDREVLVVDVHDKPGTLGELARELAAANVNIELAHTTYGGVRLVIATDDLDNARAAIGSPEAVASALRTPRFKRAGARVPNAYTPPTPGPESAAPRPRSSGRARGRGAEPSAFAGCRVNAGGHAA